MYLRNIFLLTILNMLFCHLIYAQNAYIGSERCKNCHEEQFKNYKKYSHKAKSYNSVLKMKRNLTESEYKGCLKCHTTGYGKGGFVSLKETPYLKDTGCESCHGPGGTHAESEDPEDIKGKLTMNDCVECHNEKRVNGFKFKPLLNGGAH